MRYPLLIVLLNLWVFAIMAPSVCVLLDRTEVQNVVMKLNEEEPNEQQGKTGGDIDEKQMAQRFSSSSLAHSNAKKRGIKNIYLLNLPAIFLEIVSPPPDLLA